MFIRGWFEAGVKWIQQLCTNLFWWFVLLLSSTKKEGLLINKFSWLINYVIDLAVTKVCVQMLKKIYLLFLVCFSNCQMSDAQEIIPPSNIEWYSIKKAFEMAEKEPRPIILNIYTG